jgi:hypothetical protein
VAEHPSAILGLSDRSRTPTGAGFADDLERRSDGRWLGRDPVEEGIEGEGPRLKVRRTRSSLGPFWPDGIVPLVLTARARHGVLLTLRVILVAARTASSVGRSHLAGCLLLGLPLRERGR